MSAYRGQFDGWTQGISPDLLSGRLGLVDYAPYAKQLRDLPHPANIPAIIRKSVVEANVALVFVILHSRRQQVVGTNPRFFVVDEAYIKENRRNKPTGESQ